jgi:hypothetical protein
MLILPFIKDSLVKTFILCGQGVLNSGRGNRQKSESFFAIAVAVVEVVADLVAPVVRREGREGRPGEQKQVSRRLRLKDHLHGRFKQFGVFSVFNFWRETIDGNNVKNWCKFSICYIECLHLCS